MVHRVAKTVVFLPVALALGLGDGAMTPSSALVPVTALTAEPIDCSAIRITWKGPIAASRSYRIRRDGVSLASATALPYVDSRKLRPNTTYTYTVVALYPQGTGPSTSVRVTTPLCSVTDFTLSPTDCNTNVLLRWSFSLYATGADNVIGRPSSYAVYRGRTELRGVTSRLGDLSTTFSKADPGLAVGRYAYTVIPVFGSVRHRKSMASITLAQPGGCTVENVTAVASACTSVAVNWNAPSSDRPSRYDVYRDGTRVGSAASAPYTDVVASATTHTYAVKAIYTGDAGYDPAMSVSATTALCPVQSLAATADGCTTITAIRVSWTPPDSTAPASYRVYRDGALLETTTALALTDTSGLAPYTSHEYRVVAVGADGVEGEAVSRYSTTPGCEVANLTAWSTCHTVDLNWSPPSIGPPTAYNVYRDGQFLYQRPDLAFADFSGLGAGTTYTYEVSAVYGTAVAGRAPVTATTGLCPVEKLRVANTSASGDVELAWNAPVSGAPLRYDIARDGVVVANTTALTFRDHPPAMFNAPYAYSVTPSYDTGGGPARSVSAFLEGTGTVTNFRGEVIVESGCKSVQFEWTPPAQRPDSYRFYRNGYLIGTPSGSATATSPGQNVLCRATYRYEIRPVYGGQEAAGASTSVTLPPPDLPAAGYSSLVLMVKPADVSTEDGTVEQVRSIAYTDAFSVNATLAEMTYGKTSLPEGPIHGWIQLPKTRAEYGCLPLAGPPDYSLSGCRVSDIWNDAKAIVEASQGPLPAVDLRFLAVSGAVGAFSGGSFIQFGGFHVTAPTSWHHEVGHFTGRVGLGHSSEWFCPNDVHVGPSLATVTEGGCRILAYVDRTTVLSSGYHHHTAYHKAGMGALDESSVRVLPEFSGADEMTLYVDQLEVARAPGDSAFDRRFKEIRIPLGTDMWYSIEYRIPVGFDAKVPGSDASGNAVAEGVIVRYKAQGSVGNQWGSDLYTSATASGIRMFNPGSSFYDPYRRISVEVLDKFGTGAEARARIRIRRGF